MLMKSDKYQRRFYRDWAKAKDLYSLRVTAKETDLQILSDQPVEKEFAQARLGFYRRGIESYIAKDRRFLTALKPLSVEFAAAPIVREMTQAARLANVGPMAAVAGAIAQHIGKDILKEGPKEVIVENGGDIFLKLKKIRNIAIYAGSSSLSGKLCLRIKPKDTPLGIATSSGSVGHSLNFGNADAVVVLAKSALLADAVATATANRVRTSQDFEKAVDFARRIRGILGVVIIIREHLVSWGKIEFTQRGLI